MSKVLSAVHTFFLFMQSMFCGETLPIATDNKERIKRINQVGYFLNSREK